MLIDRDFKPEVGFVRRTDVRRSFGQLRFSPRPRRSRVVRKLTWQASLDYVTDAAATAVQSREAAGLFRIDFQSSDQASVEYSREFERLPAPFHDRARRGRAGRRLHRHDHAGSATRSASSGASRAGSSARPARSTTAPDRKPPTAAAGAWCRASRSSRALTLNWVQLPYGDFNARLVSSRFTVTPSARMRDQQPGAVQRRSRTTSSSLRLRWEYTGGSELFVVYSDGRDTAARASPRLRQPDAGDQGDAAVPVLTRRTPPYRRRRQGTMWVCPTGALAPQGPMACTLIDQVPAGSGPLIVRWASGSAPMPGTVTR